MKEDEKNEKIIRGLLKLPPNRRCINCNSLGPQYVCTNFWTFVCTACSGMHREFTHRVKSISMAKFTVEEVAALKKGGNERAREIYFMDWDPQRHSIPDNSNIESLRTFIKDVYVNKRYAHERTVDKLPRVNSDNLLRVKLGDRDYSYENRGVVSQLAGSQSPPVENAYLHHFNEKSRPYGSNDERSPVSERASRYGHRRSPIHFEVVDDRFRDEHFGNNKIYKDRRPLRGGSTMVVSPPNHQKELGKSNFPLVHPVRDILEEDIPTPCIDEPPTMHCGQLVDSSMKIARSFSTPEFNDRTVDLKGENIVSLIDFDVDPESTDVGTVTSEHHATSTTKESVTQCSTSSIDCNNWASFDSITKGNISETLAFSNPHAPQCVSLPSEAPLSSTPSGQSTNKLEDQSFEHSKTHANTNSIESVLSQLLAPTTVPMTNHYALPIGDSSAATTPVGDESLLASIGGLPTRGGASLSTAITVQSSKQIAMSIGGSLDNQEPLFVPNGMPPQAAPQPAQNASGRVASLPVLQEAKSTGSKELPEDLFTTTYSSAPGPVVGWQTGFSHGEPFGAHYHSGMPMLTSPHSAKSANPFDTVNAPVNEVSVPKKNVQNEGALGGESYPSSFPSMASLHGALANVAAQPGLLRTFSLGTLSSQMMAPQSPTYAARPPSFVPAAPPSTYVGQQQAPRNLPALGHQRNEGYGVEGAAFSTSNKDQEVAHGYSFPTTPDTFSLCGQNPFG